jgi:hypothetical protein
VTELAELVDERPTLRGVLHGFAFIGSWVVGVLFVAAAPGSRVLPAAAFATSATFMLGLYGEDRRTTRGLRSLASEEFIRPAFFGAIAKR